MVGVVVGLGFGEVMGVGVGVVIGVGVFWVLLFLLLLLL